MEPAEAAAEPRAKRPRLEAGASFSFGFGSGSTDAATAAGGFSFGFGGAAEDAEPAAALPASESGGTGAEHERALPAPQWAAAPSAAPTAATLAKPASASAPAATVEEPVAAQEASPPSRGGRLGACDAMLAWLAANGAEGLDNVEVCDGGAAVGCVLRCKRLVGPDEPLLRLPVQCLLSPVAALRRPLGAAVAAALEQDGQTWQTVQLWAVLLEALAARADAAHPWHPFAATLPDTAPGALSWPSWKQELFAGTALAQATADKLASLRALHDVAVAPLIAQQHTALVGRGEEAFGFPRLLWAFGMHISRSFSTEHLRLPELGEAVLAPLFDLANHRPSAPVWWRSDGRGFVQWRANEALAPGDEVCNNYGQDPNHELLWSYGFCYRSNARDSVGLSVGAAGGPQLVAHWESLLRQASISFKRREPCGSRVVAPHHEAAAAAAGHGDPMMSMVTDDLGGALLLVGRQRAEFEHSECAEMLVVGPFPMVAAGGSVAGERAVPADAYTAVAILALTSVPEERTVPEVAEPELKALLALLQRQQVALDASEADDSRVLAAGEPKDYPADREAEEVKLGSDDHPAVRLARWQLACYRSGHRAVLRSAGLEVQRFVATSKLWME